MVKRSAALLILLLSFWVSTTHAQAGSPFYVALDSLKNTKKKTLLTLDPPRTSNTAIYFFADSSRQCRILLKSKKFFSVGPTDRVELRSLTPSQAAAVEGAFKSKRYGTLQFAIEPADGKPLTVSAVALALARLSPDFRSGPRQKAVVANRVSRRVHLADCNHLPDPATSDYFDSLDESARLNFSACILCFPLRNFSSIPGYATERELGLTARADFLSRSPEIPNHPDKARLIEAGRRVLAKWPMPLRGYEYTFGIVADDQPNAVACPSGMIFFTSGMLEILESESELEAVVAHEVAHCERRHGYQEFRSQLDHQAGIAIATLLAGAAAASQSKHASATAVDNAMAFVNNLGVIASRIAQVGHTRNNEEEADAYSMLYLTGAGLSDGTRGFDLSMSKLQYGESAEGRLPSKPDAFSSHPDIEARIVRARKTSVGLFPRATTYDGLNGRGELVASITLSAWSMSPAPSFAPSENTSGYSPAQSRLGPVYESRLYAMLEAYPDVTDRAFVRGMWLLNGKDKLWMDNYEDTQVTADATIAMSFVSRSLSQSQLTSFEGVQLDMVGVSQWVRRTGDE